MVNKIARCVCAPTRRCLVRDLSKQSTSRARTSLRKALSNCTALPVRFALCANVLLSQAPRGAESLLGHRTPSYYPSVCFRNTSHSPEPGHATRLVHNIVWSAPQRPRMGVSVGRARLCFSPPQMRSNSSAPACLGPSAPRASLYCVASTASLSAADVSCWCVARSTQFCD